MKRLMVVAKDRAFTRFVAESLLGRSMDAFMPHPDDPWTIARAHGALEAEVLVTRGRRRFHAIIVDRTLPDRSAVDLVRRLRTTELARATPVFLVTERGRDPHARRIATEELGVAGFLERPVSTGTLRAALELLDRRRRILLVEPEPELSQRHADALRRARFEVITASTPEGALRALRSFDPDVAAMALSVDGRDGVELCAHIKRTHVERSIPVVLFGQVAPLRHLESSENALRADDFVQAPFSDALLVSRITRQVGRGVVDSEPPEGDAPESVVEESRDLPTSPGRPPSSGQHEIAKPPPSASPPSVGPSQRQTRRVPCRTTLSVRDGASRIESETLDISHGGLYFALDRPLDRGDLVDLTFRLPEGGKEIVAVGRVAWSGPRGVGVKFSRIDKGDLHAIVDYVNRVSRVLYTPG